MSTANAAKPNRQFLFGCLGMVGLVVAIGVAFAVIGAINGASDSYNPNNSREAISQCEESIRQQLKSPSTAEFHSNASGSGTWTVIGTVDAQNSFGAKVRSSYQCTVTVSGPDRIVTKIDRFDG